MKKLLERDILGTIAILLVVFNHATDTFVGWKPHLYNIHSNALAALNQIFGGFTMPLFFMISGLLFQFLLEKGKYSTFKDFFMKKFKRLLVPFLFFTPLMWILFPVNGFGLQSFFTGVHHLWFIITLFYIFIIFFYFHKYLEKHIFTAFVILSVLAVMGRYLPKVYGSSGELYGLSNVMSYGLFFYLGLIIMKNYHAAILKFNPWIALGVYLIVRGIHMYYFRFDEYIWINSYMPVIEGIIGSLAVWRIAFKYTDSIMNTFGKQINYISKNSYGIYLFHLPIIYYMTELFRNSIIPAMNIYMVVIIQFIVSILISLFLTEIFRKSKLLALIIGEGK